LGWVCESHPDRAWVEALGCMCSAGMPCECNQPKEPGIDPPDYSELMTNEDEIKKH